MPRRLLPSARAAGLVATALLMACALESMRLGSTGASSLGDVLRALGARLGLAAPLAGHAQTIAELRIDRTLVTIGVGAALALSGALLQGVFRNDLASPSILGISAGAGLGASLAILTLGGRGPLTALEGLGGAAPLAVPLAAFTGAALVVFLVTTLASSGGRVSVPMLLLLGVAFNALAGGLQLAVQSLFLDDIDVSRALLAWSFGTLEDRHAWHAGLIWGALAVGAAAIPFVATELDLFAAGEEDAQALGVDTARVKLLALAAAALTASAAVAIAGQIAFVGLVVPHLVRLAVGRTHGALLGLCLLAGPLFLLGADLAQRLILPGAPLPPGVLMALLGGPLFVFLLLRNRSGVRGW